MKKIFQKSLIVLMPLTVLIGGSFAFAGSITNNPGQLNIGGLVGTNFGLAGTGVSTSSNPNVITINTGSGFTNASIASTTNTLSVSTTTSKINIVIPSNLGYFVNDSGYIATNTGNWLGIWQGTNSSTFYLATNPAGYSSSTGALSTSSPPVAFNIPYWANTTGGLSGTSTLIYDAATGAILFSTSTAPTGVLLYVATSSPIFTILSNGNIGIGTTTPQNLLVVNGGTLIDPLGSSASLIAGNGGTEGGSINVNGTTYTSTFKASDINNTDTAIGLFHKHSTSTQGYVAYARSNSSGSGHGVMTNGQIIFTNTFLGWAGTSGYQQFASIDGGIDNTGTVSNTSAPGVFGINVTPDGSVNPARVLTIINSGNVGIGTSTPSKLLTVGNNNQFTVDGSGNTSSSAGVTAATIQATGHSLLPTVSSTAETVQNLMDNAGNRYSTSTGANPTATITTTANNGSALTYMRSDASPALGTQYASSSPAWIFPDATTTAPYSFLSKRFNATTTLQQISCWEYAAATTTIEVYKATTFATTTNAGSIIISMKCGIAGNTQIASGTNTFAPGDTLFINVTSTAGTPQETSVYPYFLTN